MGKPKRRVKKFQYGKNRRKQWKNSKKLPSVGCEQLKAAWDDKKSMYANLREMGISADPNKTLKIPKSVDTLGPSSLNGNKAVIAKEKNVAKKYVVEELEREANLPQVKQQLELSKPEVDFCIYMIENYGEDYKSMRKDRKNYYQDTPKQLKKRINVFKNITSQYNAYLATKEKKMETN